MKPDVELVRLWFDYNSTRGVLIRKLKMQSDLDDEVRLDKRLYFLGRRYPYSHIVWVVHYGCWPKYMVDHKNHNQLDFRIDNLREATQNQNQHNKRMQNPNGKGVTYDGSVARTKPWIARIMVNNRSLFLGTFETSEEAAAAYREAALLHHGEFACLE